MKRSEQRRSSTGRTVGRPFAKGQSGNLGGRPKLPAELRERAQAVTADMLIALAKDQGQPGSVRVAAANCVLDRGHGKPTVSVDVQAKRSLADFTTAELLALAEAATEGRVLLAGNTRSEWPN